MKKGVGIAGGTCAPAGAAAVAAIASVSTVAISMSIVSRLTTWSSAARRFWRVRCNDGLGGDHGSGSLSMLTQQSGSGILEGGAEACTRSPREYLNGLEHKDLLAVARRKCWRA